MRRVTVIDPVRVLLNAWRLLLVGALVGAVVVAGIAKSLPKTYGSSVAIQVTPTSSSNSADTNNQQVGTEQQVATSDAVVNATAQRLGLDPASVRNALSTKAADSGEVFTISASGSSPVEAQEIAQTTANEFVSQRAAQIKSQLQEQISQNQDLVQTLVTQLTGLVKNSDAYNQLETEIQTDRQTIIQLQQQAAGNTADVSILNAAQKGLASSPGAATSGILGLLLGLLVAAGIALLRATRGERLTTTTSILSATGLPLLAQVPFSRQLTGAPGRYELSPMEADGVADSIRGLEVALRADRSGGGRMVMVASAGRFDGKTTVAAQLAAASAASGLRTILVVADTRAPAVLPGVDADALGITDVLLRGGAQLAEVLLEADVEGRGVPGLFVIPMGRQGRQGSDLLRGPRTRELMSELTQYADVVVIDSPALSVPEGLALAGAVGEVVLCIGTHDARRSVLAQTLESVSAAGATTLGAVIVDVENRLRPEHSDYDFEAPTATRRMLGSGEGQRTLRPALPERRTVLEPATTFVRDVEPEAPAAEPEPAEPATPAERVAAAAPAAEIAAPAAAPEPTAEASVSSAAPAEPAAAVEAVAPAATPDAAAGEPAEPVAQGAEPTAAVAPAATPDAAAGEPAAPVAQGAEPAAAVEADVAGPAPAEPATGTVAAIETGDAAADAPQEILEATPAEAPAPAVVVEEPAAPVAGSPGPVGPANVRIVTVPAAPSAPDATTSSAPSPFLVPDSEPEIFQALAAQFVRKFDPEAYAAIAQDDPWYDADGTLSQPALTEPVPDAPEEDPQPQVSVDLLPADEHPDLLPLDEAELAEATARDADATAYADALTAAEEQAPAEPATDEPGAEVHVLADSARPAGQDQRRQRQRNRRRLNPPHEAAERAATADTAADGEPSPLPFEKYAEAESWFRA